MLLVLALVQQRMPRKSNNHLRRSRFPSAELHYEGMLLCQGLVVDSVPKGIVEISVLKVWTISNVKAVICHFLKETLVLIRHVGSVRTPFASSSMVIVQATWSWVWLSLHTMIICLETSSMKILMSKKFWPSICERKEEIATLEKSWFRNSKTMTSRWGIKTALRLTSALNCECVRGAIKTAGKSSPGSTEYLWVTASQPQWEIEPIVGMDLNVELKNTMQSTREDSTMFVNHKRRARWISN